MANRKNQPAGLGTALKALLVGTFFVASGVGYVWYQSQIDQLGHDIGKLESRLSELRQANEKARKDLANHCSPIWLDDRAKKMNLGLSSASVTQVVHMPEPPSVPTPRNTTGGAQSK